MSDALRLLIEWPSPWKEFVAAVGPALRASPPMLSEEARTGLFPARGMALAFVLEIAALATAIAHPVEVVQSAVAQLPQRSADEVIYFSAKEMPRTEDLAGAAAGKHGTSGGASMHHASQAIRVTRSERLHERVSDVPKLNLPRSESQLSNLLAYKAPTPSPAPAEALPLERRAPRMDMVVAPPLPEIRHFETKRANTKLTSPVVVPPPVILPRRESMRNSLGALSVAPPPVSAPVLATSRPSQVTLPMPAVVAPPPELISLTPHERAQESFAQSVVPPPAQLDAIRKYSRHSLNGEVSVAPPPAEIASEDSKAASSFAGTGVRPPAVPSSSTGVVVSSKPGDKPAVPRTSESGSLSMLKSGTAALGAGREGAGRAVSAGSGGGSSAGGTSPGATPEGSSTGPNLYARNTGTPYPGPGGAGDRSSGVPRVPGVSVSGGNNVITLPSFGPPPSHSPAEHSAPGAANAVTVVASPRAGGALNLYGVLHGDRVYTIYLNTRLGTAVMQFADPDSAQHAYAGELIAPRALRVDLPSELSQAPRSQVLVRCQIDQGGAVKDLRILRADDTDVVGKLVTGLRFWKFSPAFRGNQPIAVEAIVGFGVGTN